MVDKDTKLVDAINRLTRTLEQYNRIEVAKLRDRRAALHNSTDKPKDTS